MISFLEEYHTHCLIADMKDRNGQEVFLKTPKHTQHACFTWEALCACCVTCHLLPVLAMGAAWNSLSPVGVLNPKPLGLALLSGPQQYNLCIFCDCVIHLLPDKQQWKIKRPSTDKPSPGAAISHCYWYKWDSSDSSLYMVWKILWSQKQPGSLEKQRAGLWWLCTGVAMSPGRAGHCGSVLVCPDVWCWHWAGEQGGDRGSWSQYHCLFLKVATVWCSCVVAQFQPR